MNFLHVYCEPLSDINIRGVPVLAIIRSRKCFIKIVLVAARVGIISTHLVNLSMNTNIMVLPCDDFGRGPIKSEHTTSQGPSVGVVNIFPAGCCWFDLNWIHF